MNTREPSQGENRFWESRNTFECLNIIYYFIDINGKLRTIYIQLHWLALLKSFTPPSNNNGQLTKKLTIPLS